MLNLAPIKLIDVFDRQLVDDKGTELTLSFKQFILRRLLDPRLKDMEAKISIWQIKQAIKDEQAFQYALETTDWVRLEEIVKDPEGAAAYDVQWEHSCIPFMKAIVDAQDAPFEEENAESPSDSN